LYFERFGSDFGKIKVRFWSSRETWLDPFATRSPHNQKVEAKFEETT